MEIILEALLSLSEKGARLARLFRLHTDLLTEEKTEDTKNKRFSTDYKTLADVLIQETFKHFLSQKVRGTRNVECTVVANGISTVYRDKVLVKDSNQMIGDLEVKNI